MTHNTPTYRSSSNPPTPLDPTTNAVVLFQLLVLEVNALLRKLRIRGEETKKYSTAFEVARALVSYVLDQYEAVASGGES